MLHVLKILKLILFIEFYKTRSLADSRHIAVHHKGRWFKVYCYYAGRLLTTAEIEEQLDYIVKNDELPDE